MCYYDEQINYNYDEQINYNYDKNNPFKIGDKIRWKRTGEEMKVGGDWEELLRCGDTKNYVVTTNGRVLSIYECEKI